jgi:hypothetical protein
MYCNVLLLVVLLWSAGLAGACDVVSSAGVFRFFVVLCKFAFLFFLDDVHL